MKRYLDIVPGYYTGNSFFVQAYIETHNKPPPWELKPGVLEEAHENMTRLGKLKNPHVWLK